MGPVTSRPLPADQSASSRWLGCPEIVSGRKEAVGPEIPGDGDHSPIGNAAVLLEWSANVHLVDDDVLEHGQ